MALNKNWKEVIVTDDDLKRLDTPYRDLSMDDRAKALSRVQKDYGDTVLTVVTQLLSTDVSLTMREAVMKETGSWPQWPEPKKRRGRSVKSGTVPSATPTVEQPKADRPEVSASDEAGPVDALDDVAHDELLDHGVKLCDQAYTAALGLLRLGYVGHIPSLVDMAAGVVRDAGACRHVLKKRRRVMDDGR